MIIFIQNAKSEIGKLFAEKTLNNLELQISKVSADKNKSAFSEQIGNLQTLTGSFSSLGVWKLLPRARDPPMAKKDLHGNLITMKSALKKLYLDTYVYRLRNREIKSDFQDILSLKTLLWRERLKSTKQN